MGRLHNVEKKTSVSVEEGFPKWHNRNLQKGVPGDFGCWMLVLDAFIRAEAVAEVSLLVAFILLVFCLVAWCWFGACSFVCLLFFWGLWMLVLGAFIRAEAVARQGFCQQREGNVGQRHPLWWANWSRGENYMISGPGGHNHDVIFVTTSAGVKLFPLG